MTLRDINQYGPGFQIKVLDALLNSKNFLIGEWKKPNENMATGQQLLLKAFAQVPKFTVLVIIGNTDNEQTEVGDVFQVVLGRCVRIGEGLDFLKDFYIMWYEFANSKG